MILQNPVQGFAGWLPRKSKVQAQVKIILIIDFEFKGHLMRITYSSCILFMRKLTKAYKVNRIAINYWQIRKFGTGISTIKGKGPVIS